MAVAYNLISVEKPHLRSPNFSLGRQVSSMLGAVPQLARAARAKDEARDTDKKMNTMMAEWKKTEKKWKSF